jgi:hypothetical protein
MLAHDFFTLQPVTNATVFLCRMVLHDYGRSKAASILQHLRKAATQDTKLIIVEVVGFDVSKCYFQFSHPKSNFRSYLMLV